MKSKDCTYFLLIILGALFLACASEETVPSGSGFIEATEVDISAEVSGKLIKLDFDEADQVAVDDTLAVIDTTTFALRLRQAKARFEAAKAQEAAAEIAIDQAKQTYDLARKEFERIETLLKSGSAHQQQYDQAETKFNQAKLSRDQANAQRSMANADISAIAAEIDLLKKQLSDCFPLSPINGTVITSYRERGELIGTGQLLYTIASLDTVTVKVYLPPDDLTSISLKQECQIDPEDGQNAPLDGWVKWIASEAEFTPKNVQTKDARADLVYAVEITIPNPEHRLKIGMPVMVTIP
jgi:HlyD family secretion protein